ncbi:MAG: class I SAM-dependent methyltransferase [Chloroflexota bacterium]
MATENERAIKLGQPSYIWGFGQERRFKLIAVAAPLVGARVLDIGCGIGAFLARFRKVTPYVYGVEVDRERALMAGRVAPAVVQGVGEYLPFKAETFDLVLLHEVLEHVDDDRQVLAEAWRVLRPGGRLVIFAPNRLWPFETHGIFWRGKYRFGNYPFVNYLPDPLRNRLAPHVRAYTRGQLRQLLAGLPGRVVTHRGVFPGFDKLARRSRVLAGLLRPILYALEQTPAHRFGLSHFVVFVKAPANSPAIDNS